MNTSQARRTFRAIICISCIAVPQSIVVAQQFGPSTEQASQAHTWQPATQLKTFSLPAVQKASGETLANRPNAASPIVSQSTNLQLGFPQSAEISSDPIPASPWSDNRSRNISGQPVSAQQTVSQPQAAPPLANPWNAPAPAINSPSLNPQSSVPRFIEQPSARPQVSPAPQTQPQQEIEFEINGPLTQQGNPSQFRTASNTDSFEQSMPSVPGFVLGSQGVPSTSVSYDLNANSAAPTQNDWNQLPNRGVHINEYTDQNYTDQNVQAPPALPSAAVARESLQPTSPFAQQPVEKAGTPIINPFVPQVQPPVEPQVPSEIEERQKLAEQVSKEVLSKNTSAKAPPKALENPRGWKAVEEELKARLNNCDNLLRRGATQSAREEITVGLHSLCRAIDVRDGSSLAETSLERAMTAFKEEKDFYRSSGIAESSLVAGHQTPVLRSSSTQNLSPIVASQHYRLYAKNQLLNASQGHPWAAELLYALGRTYESESESNVELGAMLREQSIACYQAAIAIDKNHVDAANQLGYSLLRVDRTREAEVALATAVSISPSPQAWKNLAEVYRRDGNVSRAEYAVQQSFALENKMNLMVNGQPMPNVVQISPEQFAHMSPNTLQQTSPSQSTLPPVNATPPVANSAAPTPNNYAAPDMSAAPQVSSKPGMLGSFKNMFR